MEFEILKKQGFKAENGTSFFEDNHVGFFRRETETLAIRPGRMMSRTVMTDLSTTKN